jgi:hypothetical protein
MVKKTILISLLLLMVSCRDTQKKDMEIIFRLLPIDIEYTNNGRSIGKYYAIEYSSDTLNRELEATINSFTCDLLKDTLSFQKYDLVIIHYLKESESTLRIKKGGITDSNNPASSEHTEYMGIRLNVHEKYIEKIKNREHIELIKLSDYCGW